MVSGTELRARADGLRSGRTPFVQATVVRAERPTSAKAGDRALVLPDGTIEGFVGGSCAESTVRLQGLRLLRTGESTLLRITPDATGTAQVTEGLVTVGNPCLSGGTLEIFLEAMMPPTLLHVFGDAPVARALASVGAAVGYEVRAVADADQPIAPDTDAVVVASHGRDEERVLAAALSAGVGYVALVASRRRGAAVLAGLALPAEQRARVRTPAGLDIGARTPQEVALSVLAEFVASRSRSAKPSEVRERLEGSDRTDDEQRSEASAFSERPEASEPPGPSEHPGASERLGPSEHPGASERPRSSEYPGASEHPGSYEPPGASERPGSSEPPGASERPRTSEHLGTSEGVGVYERSGASDASAVLAAASAAGMAAGSVADGPVAEALDPVCGMAVAVSAASLTSSHSGRTWYFCGPGCRQAFEDDPRRYPG